MQLFTVRQRRDVCGDVLRTRYMSLYECRLLSLCLVLINDLQSHCWCRVCCVVHGVGISPVDEILRKDLQQVRTRER